MAPLKLCAVASLQLASGTLLHCLAKYGSSHGLATAPDALACVQGWGKHYLAAEKAQALVDSARQRGGVAMGCWDEERLRRYAREIQQCRRKMRAARRRLCELTRRPFQLVRKHDS
jgi:hypothetical protein